jgi:large subunit ribosomal protein L30
MMVMVQSKQAKKTLVVTQIRSTIGTLENQRQSLRGLGLTKIGKTRTVEDTPSVRGLIAKVAHLVKVSA